jgi:hypothetical protein
MALQRLFAAAARTPTRRKVLGAVMGTIVFAAGLATGHVSPVPLPSVTVDWPRAHDGDSLQPQPNSGQEVALLFVISSTCSFSRHPSLPTLIQAAKSRAEQEASERGMAFRSVAVGIEWDPAAGWNFLRRFGRFDEVALGGSWANTLSLKYLLEPPGAVAATPQIILLRRDAGAPTRDDPSSEWRIENERVLQRVVGLAEINEWVQSQHLLQSES